MVPPQMTYAGNKTLRIPSHKSPIRSLLRRNDKNITITCKHPKTNEGYLPLL